MHRSHGADRSLLANGLDKPETWQAILNRSGKSRPCGHSAFATSRKLVPMLFRLVDNSRVMKCLSLLFFVFVLALHTSPLSPVFPLHWELFLQG